MDLFNYPASPGFKKTDTSRAAAVGMAPRASTIRAKVLAALVTGDFTADEMAAHLGIDKLAVRPRFSELKRTGRIHDTGTRRANTSNKSAIVWRVNQ